MTTTICKLQQVTYILRDMGIPISGSIPLHCDSKAAMHITANSVFHEWTKHLDINCHVVRDQYKSEFVSYVMYRLRISWQIVSRKVLVCQFSKRISPSWAFWTVIRPQLERGDQIYVVCLFIQLFCLLYSYVRWALSDLLEPFSMISQDQGLFIWAYMFFCFLYHRLSLVNER